MATPLDLRNRRREAQRSLRLALNAVNAGLDDWKASVTEGKRHATALTNATLTWLHLPALTLGPLADVPDLRAAVSAKLQRQQAMALAELATSLDLLSAALARLGEAVGGLQQLLDAEAELPLLMDRPVFATLPLNFLSGMVEEVREEHAAELAVKAAVVQGFEQIVGELTRSDQEPDGAGGRASVSAEQEERVRRRMQVYLTAWMLSPEVDEQRVAAHLDIIRADMRGF